MRRENLSTTAEESLIDLHEVLSNTFLIGGAKMHRKTTELLPSLDGETVLKTPSGERRCGHKRGQPSKEAHAHGIAAIYWHDYFRLAVQTLTERMTLRGSHESWTVGRIREKGSLLTRSRYVPVAYALRQEICSAEKPSHHRVSKVSQPYKSGSAVTVCQLHVSA